MFPIFLRVICDHRPREILKLFVNLIKKKILWRTYVIDDDDMIYASFYQNALYSFKFSIHHDTPRN